MATFNGNLNLLDLITNQDNDPLTGLIEDVPTYAPEFSQIPVTIKPGITYKILKRTALPPSGFRAFNQGIGTSKSSYKQEVKEMFPLDVQIFVDEQIVQSDDESAGDILTHEAQGALQSAIITLGAQTYYGTSNDVNGFDGVRAQTTNNIGAGGTTNSTSAYALWLHPWGVNYPVGLKGSVAMKPWAQQFIASSNTVTTAGVAGSTGHYNAYVSNISARIGLTVGSNYSVFAVTGIQYGNGTTTFYPLTDRLASQLLSLIPLNRRQGLCWFMNRQTHWTLWQSRSTVNVGANAGLSYGLQPSDGSGRPQFAPPPESLCGYPIVLTDSIQNTESN